VSGVTVGRMLAQLARAVGLSLGLLACSKDPAREQARPPSRASAVPSAALASATPAPAPAPAPQPPRSPLVLVAGGDVNLGRKVGQRILRDAAFDPFVGIRPVLSRADIAFANLESPLSDQNGETEDRSRLAFVGPPAGAGLLARAPFHVVSVANNHAWDYERRGFLDTLTALEGAGVPFAGGSRLPGSQYEPVVLTVKGWSVALFAVTHLWNPGGFANHEAREHVAWADDPRLLQALRAARKTHDLVLVSYHGGKEYVENAAQEPLDFARSVMAAGADAVLAHHPHVPQGVGWYEGRPIFYSLGNLVFGRHRDHPWTGRGYLARLTFMPDKRVEVAACPYLIDKSLPHLAIEPAAQQMVVRYLRRASTFASAVGTDVRAVDEQGCFELVPDAG